MTQVNLQNRKGLTVLENEPVAAGGDVGIGREIGRDVYTLRSLKWRTNKDLLWTTGNSAQRHGPAWTGGSLGGMDPCMRVAECLRCSPGTAVTPLVGSAPTQNKKAFGKRFRGRCACVLGSDGAVPTRPSSRSADADRGYVAKVQQIKKRNILRCYQQPQVNCSSEREDAQGIRDGAWRQSPSA